jgi:hypothetical protein
MKEYTIEEIQKIKSKNQKDSKKNSEELSDINDEETYTYEEYLKLKSSDQK